MRHLPSISQTYAPFPSLPSPTRQLSSHSDDILKHIRLFKRLQLRIVTSLALS